jgi:hypothetical protein
MVIADTVFTTHQFPDQYVTRGAEHLIAVVSCCIKLTGCKSTPFDAIEFALVPNPVLEGFM